MRKLSIIFFLMFSLLVCGMTQALSIDVTSPGDTVQGIPNDGDWPPGEAPPLVIDNDIYTKFLHFKGDNQTSGFQVTPSLGGMIVTGMTLTTGNDAPERDPITVELWGSNDSIDGPYTLIATIDVVDFNQADAWPRNTKNETPIAFDNDVAYDHYQVLFTNLRVWENGCCMQISEVELLADVTPVSGWAYRDIDTSGGNAWEDDGTITIRADGHDIWGGSDGFGYLYRPLLGDGYLDVDLVEAGNTNAGGWSKVGPMIRETISGGSRHGMTAMTPTHGIQFVWRLDPGGGSYGAVKAGQTTPKLLRIERSGNLITSKFFGPGLPGMPPTWQTIGTPQTITMGSDAYIGIAVCAGNTAALNYGVLDNVALTAPPVEIPWAMSPEDGAEHVSLTPTLTWMAGDSATSHDVYLGTDPAALPLVAPNLEVESYTPDTLSASTTYYWQVIEQPGDAGPVFSFTTLYEAPWWTGSLKREIWGNMWWEEIQRMIYSARYMEPPDHVDEVTESYSPDIGWSDYGLQLTGHLIPGTSGDYTFWIAADDGSELRLNTNNDVADLAKICGWYRYSGNFDAHPELMSATIPLVGGQKYAIKIMVKEGGGGDWVDVAWEGPDAPSRTRITGDFLTRAFSINPKPDIRDTLTPLEAETLSWQAGKYATEQEVLFGTDPGAMAPIATALPPETTTLPMPAVASGNTYYWQVNCTDGTEVWEGDVWSFTVSDWVSRDIGPFPRSEASPTVPPGSHTYDPGTGIHLINADGGDIWAEWDEFHYYYTTMKLTRDIGEVKARVLSIPSTNDWSKSGVMIRESLAATSRNAFTQLTWNQAAGLHRRYDTRGGSASDNWWGITPPRWVRLTRDHNRFNSYWSDDGENWNHIAGTDVAMQPDKYCYIGLAVTSHNAGTIGTATFDNLSITTPDIRQSWNLNPPNGSTMVDIHVTLTWGAGEGCTEHRVYFSEDEEAVVNRTATPTILPPETTELYVGPLDLGHVYYWCVDEVINPVIPGEVLSFTAEEYRTIDDFESYDVGPEALPPQVATPGEIIVEAVPPPDQAWVEPVTLVDAIEPGTDCLVSRWDFEGDYTDSAGSNDGTPNGGVSLTTDAERGNVASLDGVDGYVDCGNPADLNFGTNDWTVSVWLKTTVSNQGVPYGNGGDGGGGIRCTLGVGESNSDRVTLTCDDDGKPPGSAYGKLQAHATTNVTDDVWHHVMGVREGSRIRIYTDGNLESDVDLGGADFDLTGIDQHNVLLGAIWHHGGYIQKFFTGELDDIRVYNCALTTENARYLAEVGPLVKPGYYGPCIAHYAFDEGSGSTATDSSGNGLDGAISGAEYTATTADGSAWCLDFGGDGDNVLNTDAGPYLNNLDALSISLWIQSDLIDTDKGFFMGADSDSDRYGMRYDAAGGSGGGDDVAKYGVMTTGGNEEDESSQYLQTTEWQHLVLSWQSGAGIKLYVNGVLNIPTSDTGPVSGVLTGYTRIMVGKGGKDQAADAGWDGRIDDVRVYDYALSEGEARYLAGVGNIALPDRYTPMLAQYEFEGNLEDSSGNNRNGTAVGDGITIEDDPDMGQVLSLPGGDDVFVQVGEVGISGAMQRSIACWAKADHTSIPDWTLIFGFTTTGGGDNTHFNIGSLGGPGGVGAHVWGWEATIFSDEQALDWRHYAMTYNGNTVRYYGDGVQVGAVDRGALVNADNVHIGSRITQTSSFPGKVDDARIYDYPLTLGQIRTLANYVPTNPLTDTWSGRASATPALQYLGGAHEGAQCMRVEYSGSGAVTRLEPWNDGAHPHGWNSDFSLGQAQALSLWFKGDPDNAPGAMFAQLTTVVPSGNTQRVMYDGDPEDLLNPNWQEFTMSLKSLSTGKPDFPELGLPITKIKDVGVGIIGAGGGVLYFDDLRLYPIRCVPKYGPAYDLTDDCVVDREDMAVVANAWLAEEGGNGLWYEYYEGWWDVLPYFPSMPLITQGTADNFGVGPRERDDGFGLRFTGVVVAPVGGDYKFFTSSDDGSKLYIDGTQVVDNDGLHGMQWMEGTINLIAGEHLIEVIMFENGGGEGLEVEVEGPGIPRTPVPNEVLFLAPGIPADLNGDGIVNFLDYADMLNHFGDEALFPASGDLL